MNCCDYDCNQGRNCPARGAKVARIGRKDYTREELPPTLWRRQLRSLAKWMLVVLSMLFYGALFLAMVR